jgi:hypothetical protein
MFPLRRLRRERDRHPLLDDLFHLLLSHTVRYGTVRYKFPPTWYFYVGQPLQRRKQGSKYVIHKRLMLPNMGMASTRG